MAENIEGFRAVARKHLAACDPVEIVSDALHGPGCNHWTGGEAECDSLAMTAVAALRDAGHLPDAPADAARLGVDRESLDLAVGGVLFNVTNYPERVQALMLGQDIGPLRQKVVDAILAAQPTTPAPVDGHAVERSAREIDPPAFDPQSWISVDFGMTPERMREMRQDAARKKARAILTAARFDAASVTESKDGPTPVEMSVSEVLLDYDDGERQGWVTEFAWLREHHSARLASIAASARADGIREPIVLGYDGRVWDGHHRLCVALDLGLTSVPVIVIPGGAERG